MSITKTVMALIRFTDLELFLFRERRGLREKQAAPFSVLMMPYYLNRFLLQCKQPYRFECGPAFLWSVAGTRVRPPLLCVFGGTGGNLVYSYLNSGVVLVVEQICV